jgi:hypothetical protein
MEKITFGTTWKKRITNIEKEMDFNYKNNYRFKN